MATMYSCPICKYTTYTGYECGHPERAASLVGAVDYANKVAGPQPTAPKMTREQAINKVAKACGIPIGVAKGNIVDALEALGLLKFEQPVEPKLNESLEHLKATGKHDLYGSDQIIVDAAKSWIVDGTCVEVSRDMTQRLLNIIGGLVRVIEKQPKAQTVSFGELHDAIHDNADSLYQLTKLSEVMNTKGWKIVKEG